MLVKTGVAPDAWRHSSRARRDHQPCVGGLLRACNSRGRTLGPSSANRRHVSAAVVAPLHLPFPNGLGGQENQERDIEQEEQELLSSMTQSREESSQVYLALYLGLSVLAMLAGYYLQPTLLHLTASITGIKPSEDSFESSFFGLLSIVYSVFAGQTFLFLYERQINIVQELYGEVFALEMLVQQTFLVCNDLDLRVEMARTVRQYMMEEVYIPVDTKSPFNDGSAYMDILLNLVKMQERGMPVAVIVDACKQLADAQSRRSSMAASILPMVHWIFMHGMELIFVLTFLVFDASNLDMTTAGTEVPEERRLFFGALFGLLALTTQVLKDLDDPVSGLYGFRTSLSQRTRLVEQLLIQLEMRPADYVPNSVRTLEFLGIVGDSSADHEEHVRPVAALEPKGDSRWRRANKKLYGGLRWGQKR